MEVLEYRGPLKQRRALICRSKTSAKWIDPIIVWIDDDNSCALLPQAHEDKNPLYHPYRMATGLTAIRCPRSIADDEKWRVVVDYPVGSAMLKFKSFLAEHGKHSPVSSKPHSDADGTEFSGDL